MKSVVKKILLLSVIAAFAGLLFYTDLVRIGTYLLLTRWLQAPDAGPSLADYRVDYAARPLSGLDKNASGLTFNPASNTLFVVVNRPPTIAELSLDGQVLRQLPLPGVSDTEGITHVQDYLFIVSDEKNKVLHWFEVAPGSNVAVSRGVLKVPLGFTSLYNQGIEGVSWDDDHKQLLLTNENLPRRVLLVDGVGLPGHTGGQAPGVARWEPRGWLGPLGRDLASLTVAPDSGNLLLLSEASGLLTEYSRDGRVMGLLPLWRGVAGLEVTIPQPEGLTFGPDRSIYIVSEPNLLSRFVLQKP